MNRVVASFTSGERNIIVFVLIMVAAGGGILEWRSAQQNTMTFSAAPTSERAAELSAPEAMPPGIDNNGLIDINLADEKVLEVLPGIGPSLAGSIVRHRSGNGAFQSIADLDSVPGIGPAMMTKLAPMVIFGTAGSVPAPADQVDAPVSAIAPFAIPSPSTGAPININTADTLELDKLKGIGPALAQRIVQHRQTHGFFRSADEILQVKGIGPKFLQDNLNRLSVN